MRPAFSKKMNCGYEIYGLYEHRCGVMGHRNNLSCSCVHVFEEGALICGKRCSLDRAGRTHVALSSSCVRVFITSQVPSVMHKLQNLIKAHWDRSCVMPLPVASELHACLQELTAYAHHLESKATVATQTQAHTSAVVSTPQTKANGGFTSEKCTFLAHSKCILGQIACFSATHFMGS